MQKFDEFSPATLPGVADLMEERLLNPSAARKRGDSVTSRRSSRRGAVSDAPAPPVRVVEAAHVSTLKPGRLGLDLRLWTVYKHVAACQDTLDVFMELPSEADYPEYYRLIAHPICLGDVHKKMQGQAYSTVRTDASVGVY